MDASGYGVPLYSPFDSLAHPKDGHIFPARIAYSSDRKKHISQSFQYFVHLDYEQSTMHLVVYGLVVAFAGIAAGIVFVMFFTAIWLYVLWFRPASYTVARRIHDKILRLILRRRVAPGEAAPSTV